MSTIALQPALRSDAAILANLFELYVYDFSEWVPLELGESGRFEIPLGDWWDDAAHHPFFIRRDGKLVGFALARKGSRITGATDVMDVADFFVVRGARRQNVGLAAARALLEAFPSRWEIRVRDSNPPAFQFWSRAVEAHARPHALRPFENAEGTKWRVFSVER